METFVLRKKPKLEISLGKEDFRILDESDKGINGVYAYKFTQSMRMREKSTNWVITTLSFLLEFLLPEAAFSKIITERYQLTFLYNEEKKRVFLENCVKEKIADLVKNLGEVLPLRH